MLSVSPNKHRSQPLPLLRPRTRDVGVTAAAALWERGNPPRESHRRPPNIRGGSGPGSMLTWTAHLRSGVPPNIYHATVAVGTNVYSFGGFRNDTEFVTNEVHVFNTVSLRWKQLPCGNQRPPAAPAIHEGYTAVLIGGSTVYVWGGCSSVAGGEWRCHDVLYAFGIDDNGGRSGRRRHRWSRPQASGSLPEARGNHSACAVGATMYVYGGATRRRGQTNSLHTLDTSTMVWTAIAGVGSPPPPTSSLHSSTAIGTTLYMFGGLGDHGECYGHVRAFDTRRGRWQDATTTATAHTRPEGRFGHSAFAHGGELYVFGGGDWNHFFTDLWRFSPGSGATAATWKKVHPKGEDVDLGPSQPGCWMYSCPVGDDGDRVVLFKDPHLHVLDFGPSLKTLCKQAVVRHGLKRSGLPHNVRWEMAAMTTTQQGARRSVQTPAARAITGGNRRG